MLSLAGAWVGSSISASSLLGPLGCATAARGPTPGARRIHSTPYPGCVIETPDTFGPADTAWLRTGLERARERCVAFGLAPPRALTLGLHNDVRTFIAATGRETPWLRAYAQYARADFLTPDMWTNRTPRARTAKVVHEVWHVAMFQSLGGRAAARAALPPGWFREGSASVVAAQAFARLPLAAICALAGPDPLSAPPAQQKVAYAAAHHASVVLVADFGPRVFSDVCAALKAAPEGAPDTRFHAALATTTGLDTAQLWARTRASVPT